MSDVLTAGRGQYVARQRIARKASTDAAKAWAQLNPAALRPSWSALVAPALLAIVTAAQRAVAEQASGNVASLLQAQNIDVDDTVVVQPAAFAGHAADGRELASLFDTALYATLTAIAAGVTQRRALDEGRRFVALAAGSEVTDAARQSTAVATVAQRNVGGSVRVLTPPSCSRCAVLAGRWYRWSTGFQRHVAGRRGGGTCDCRMIPARSAADLADYTRLWTAQSYFDSLTREQQDRIFTIDGARAIRDGADIGRIVNARRGMSTTVIGGRTVQTTTAGAGGIRRRVRLVPESIYRIAGGDRTEAMRLLLANGYLTA